MMQNPNICCYDCMGCVNGPYQAEALPVGDGGGACIYSKFHIYFPLIQQNFAIQIL